MRLEEGGGDLNGLLRVFVAEDGVDDLPVGVVLLDLGLGDVDPLILVGDGRAGVVEGDLLGAAVGILHLVGGHLDQELTKLLRGALADVEGAVLGVDVGVPGKDDDALLHGALEGLVEAVGRERRNGDGVVALVDEVVDVLDLAGNAGGAGAVVLDEDAQLLAHFDGAFAARLEEAHAGQLGNEGDLYFFGQSGAAEGGKNESRREYHHQFLFHVHPPPLGKTNACYEPASISPDYHPLSLFASALRFRRYSP